MNLKVLSAVFIMGVINTFCSKKSSQIPILNLGEDNSISLNYEGKPRIKGILPLSENNKNNLTFKGKSESQGTQEIYSFSSEGKEAIEFRVELDSTLDVYKFFISPNNDNKGSGTNLVGLFFEQLPGFKVGTSSYRYGPWNAWTMPIKIDTLSEMKGDNVQFFIYQYEDGLYAAVMPLCGKGYRSTLGSENGKIGAKALSYKDSTVENDIPMMAVAFDKDPYKLIDNIYLSGMTEMGKAEGLRRNKIYPETFGYIAWCTWNSFGMDKSESKIINSVKTFTDKGFQLGNVLVDDGWMKIDTNRRLQSFYPDSTKFPNGFHSMVNTLKNDYHIKNIGVWHTLNAYWNGVDPDSYLGKDFKEILTPYKEQAPWLDSSNLDAVYYAPTFLSDRGYQFFDKWYDVIKKEGITFVKTDNQLVVERMAVGKAPLWNASEQIQKNFQEAVKKHFNGAVINCMDMTSDAFYNFGPSAVGRAVEDYFPEEKSYEMNKGNAAVHVLCALQNSLWFSQLVWPDFDMFQSHHPDANFHAIARAVSGGPVYLTDVPGKQNISSIEPLVLNDGKVIRADIPARPTKDCLFQTQDPLPFKAFSLAKGAGLLGIWNVADKDHVTGSFAPSDVYGLKGDKFLVYEYFSGKVDILDYNQTIPVTLDRMGYKYYNIVPINNALAVLGLINKYNAPATIRKQFIVANELTIVIPEGGTLGVYCKKPISVKVDELVLDVKNYNWQEGLLKINIDKNGNVKERKAQIYF
jgi:hypothetical protein